MIGRLNGVILAKQPPHLLIDVGGVAYEVEASMNTFYRLPAVEQKVTLHTHFVVREDAQLLYGFYEQNERILFRTLIKVNGVGPKLALTILSSITPDEFTRCVHDNDSATLVKLPGVGKKTAERLIIEMRDRLSKLSEEVLPSLPGLRLSTTEVNNHNPAKEAISGLVALGYKPQEASRAIHQINTQDLNSAEIIRLALKAMG